MSFIASVTRCPVPLPHNMAYTTIILFFIFWKLLCQDVQRPAYIQGGDRYNFTFTYKYLRVISQFTLDTCGLIYLLICH
jgi:hypothetical protein